jgi:hypothetical protein
MKTLGIILCIAGVLLIAACAADSLQVTTRKQSFPERNISIQRTYRGGECILLEMTKGATQTRVFRINGKTVMAESDEDHDGLFESVMIFDPHTGDFEWFTRTTNNFLHPVASEKLQNARAKKESADKALSDYIEPFTR